MANIAYAGERASEKEIKKELMTILADNWTGAFTVDFWSDGGGRMARAVVECSDTNGRLDEAFTSKLPLKFMGWRLVILKVPIGHIRIFHS